VHAAPAAGVGGFLLKGVTPGQLVAAVRLARTGDALPPLGHPPDGRTVRRGTGHARRGQRPRRGRRRERRPPGATPATPATGATAGPPATPAPARAGCDVSALPPRELEVLGLVARGLSNAEVTSHLVLSEATVKTHVARIRTKPARRDRVQAVVPARETGLLSHGS
jgi:DNA-binding NarL/FixJ family response regulator